MSGFDLSEITNGLGRLSIVTKNLPIASHRDRIIKTIRENQTVIIYGETGSGKTTQIPQYLYKAEINNDLIIGITQPRRIAAVSMATRVSEELGCGLGIEVGYEVRFDNKSGASTKIKYMTDGTLLNHCLTDPKLGDYGVIMIDEAHERSIHTDVLLGLLKIIANKRKDLKILITSATMKTEMFSKYFNNAPIVSFEGRFFPVEVVYEPSYSYTSSTIQTTRRIHQGNEPGDILIFLTGQDEIETCCDSLSGIPNLVVMPLFASMDSDAQNNVFSRLPIGQRKVVVSTNIAETTITIEGIKYVIDCGYVKQCNFIPRLGIEVLQEVRISKAQADQRKGRAGRTCEGYCYRLYSNQTYQEMSEETSSEIKRKNLSEVYLKLVTIGLDPLEFDFIDCPSTDTLKATRKQLQDLELLNSSGGLTPLGKSMSDLPVEPILGRVLLKSHELNCTRDIIIIMSMMSERNVFIRPRRHSAYANARHSTFYDPNGDHFTRLNIFKEFLRNGKSKNWCHLNYMNYDTLIRVVQARDQLTLIMQRKGLLSESTEHNPTAIKGAIIDAYFQNKCFRKTRGVYIRITSCETLYIHPSSSLFKESPQTILYHDVLQTKKPYMHGIMKLS